MVKLREYLERFPYNLDKMNHSMKTLLLHHAIASGTVGKIPYTIRRSLIDNKPSLVVEVSHFDTKLGSGGALTTRVALPFNCTPRNIEVPDREAHYALLGQADGTLWLGLELPEAKQRNLFDIAAYVVSQLHLRSASYRQIGTSLATLSATFGVPLLFRHGENDATFVDAATLVENLAEYGQERSMMTATDAARAMVSNLPLIKVPNLHAAYMVYQVIDSRFMHTQDLWLAWADGANAADMHFKHSEEMADDRDICSEAEQCCELHPCGTCGARTTCKSLTTIIIDNSTVRCCPACTRRPTVRLGSFVVLI